jgi:light-regulated signal transduction histidine kinase (bacteriophytochrome)
MEPPRNNALVGTEEHDVRSLLAALEEVNALRRAEEARHSEELLQFAYAMSHDLREPMRMVTGYAQLLNTRYKTAIDDDGRQFLGYIVEGVRRMEHLLNDLVKYSHQLRGFDTPLSSVDPEAVLEGVLLNLQTEIRECGAQITSDALPAVRSDSARLGPVFHQLIANSIKFHGPEPPRVHISAVQTEEETIFTFRDNGLGIDPRYHEQIFNPFRRLHGREYPGPGLGLAICKRIVNQHGGRIWVESEAGNGAAFLFSLPL